MKTKESKARGKKVTLKDLPAKRLSREQEAKVKGGADPVSNRKLQ